MLNLIDPQPMRQDWGQVWQSGVIASEDAARHINGAHLTVSMSGNQNFEGPCLWLRMPDDDVYTLRDATLVAMVKSVIAFLSNDWPVLIHCNEGKYRSTYMDVAVHMAVLRTTADQALGYVRRAHPIADLRVGTLAQLRRMEIILKGVTQ